MPGTEASIRICFRNEKAGVFRRPPKLPQARRRQSISEAVHPAHRYRLQRLASEAGTRSIFAIGGNAVAARAEVVVPSGLIGLAGIHRIPVALLVEVVLVPDRVHVGRVVDGPGVTDYLSRGAPAGLPRGFCCVRPSDVEVVLAGDFLS